MRLHSFITVFLYCQTVHALWPVPVSFTNGSDILWIQQSIAVTYNGEQVNLLEVHYSQGLS
jgi:hypothetical protein